MPFITEELWHAIYQQKAPVKSIALIRFPLGADLSAAQKFAIREMQIIQGLITDIRNRRTELKVEPRTRRLPIRVYAGGTGVRALLQSNRALIDRDRLAGVESIEFTTESLSKFPGAQVRGEYELLVIYEKKIDVAAERERLSKEVSKLESERDNAKRQLGNESFLAKAPALVVEGLRRRSSELEQLLLKTRVALEELQKAKPEHGLNGSNGSHG
jgi:valyl-tRNA synthetase